MPQILKDDVKQRIVEAAREEFLEKSYENSSMRSIASRSQMTVGNLYRYFRNKEELNRFIVGPTMKKINSLIMKLTGNRITLENMDSISLSAGDLIQMLDDLASGLVDIYAANRIEVNILMMHSGVNDSLVGWFSQAILQIIAGNYKLPADQPRLKLLAHGYAVSIFEGIKYMLKESQLSEEELKETIKIYIRSYIDALDAQFGRVRVSES